MDEPEVKETKKTFVEPKLTEEASLEDVTLMSGGVSYGHPSNLKKPKHAGRSIHGRGRNHGNGHNTRHS